MASEAFAQEIAAAHYFNQVVICDSALQAFDQVQKDRLIQALEVDMLFAIERVEVELQKGTYYLSDVMTNVPVVDGSVTLLWFVRTLPVGTRPCFPSARQTPFVGNFVRT